MIQGLIMEGNNLLSPFFLAFQTLATDGGLVLRAAVCVQCVRCAFLGLAHVAVALAPGVRAPPHDKHIAIFVVGLFRINDLVDLKQKVLNYDNLI